MQVDDKFGVIIFVLSQPGECMIENRQVRDAISSEVSGTKERGLGSKPPGDLRNLLIVGADQNACYCFGLGCGGNAEGDQWKPGKGTDIFARNTLRAASGRNDCQDFGCCH